MRKPQLVAPRELCPHCNRPLPRGADALGPWGRARVAAGLSTREVSKRTGISASTINRVDYDASNLTLGDAVTLARVYGVDPLAMAAAPEDNKDTTQ